MRFISGMKSLFNIQKSINVGNTYINRLKHTHTYTHTNTHTHTKLHH